MTGNAKKLEEVRAAGASRASGFASVPPCLVTPFSLRRSRRSSGTPLPTRWWRRKLTVSCWQGLAGCEGSARPRRVLSTAPSPCPQCPSTRGSQTRSRCRSAAKPPGR